MSIEIDLMDLVDELARIAAATSDPETGRKLMDMATRLLAHIGLPPGGGEAPGSWISEPMREAA